MMTLHDLRAEPRPLWQAIAHQLVDCRPGDRRLPLLNSLYCDLSPADKLRCQGELWACRRAKRAEMLAEVTP